MRKLISDEKGLVIVEAVYVFPIVILVTISLYFMAIFLYGRVQLQRSVDWYVDLGCAAISSSAYNITAKSSGADGSYDSGNAVNVSALSEPLFPYRHFTASKKDLINQFRQMAGDESERFSGVSASNIDVDIEIVNWVVYKEVVGNARKTYTFPINLSLIGLPSDVTLYASSKRIVSDQDELIRNIDVALDVASFIGDKINIKGMFDKVKGYFTK